MLDGTEYFSCTCGAPDHTLRFILDLEENEDIPVPTFYTEVMMSHYQPWYKRIWIGFKYVFGYSKPDHYGCWEIHHDDVDRMITMLTKLKDADVKYQAIRTLKNLKFKEREINKLYNNNNIQWDRV